MLILEKRNITKKDIEDMNTLYLSGEWKKDPAQYHLNLFAIYEYSLRYGDDLKTLRDLVKNETKFSMSSICYQFFNDIKNLMETKDRIDFSKYDGLLDSDSRYGSNIGKKEQILILSKRNKETEFVILLKKLDITGILMLFKLLRAVRY